MPVVDIKKWGREGWVFLHSMTLSYPDNPTPQDKQNMKQFLLSVGKLLPCTVCRNNYAVFLKQNPITDNVLRCKCTVSKWLLKMHNEENVRAGKQTLTYEELKQIYFATS